MGRLSGRSLKACLYSKSAAFLYHAQRGFDGSKAGWVVANGWDQEVVLHIDNYQR